MDPNDDVARAGVSAEAAGVPEDCPAAAGEPWTLGPPAGATRDDPGSDPYNCTGRFTRPIFDK